MALQKSKSLSNGTSGNYWRITKEHYDRITHIATWTISLFKDRDCGMAGAGLGLHKTYYRELTPTEARGNRTELGYNFIKAKANEMVPKFPPVVPPELVPYDADLKDAVDA